MTEQEIFAYGDWEVSGCKCPIEQAGLTGDEFATEVAEKYDWYAQEFGKADTGGIIEKEEAEQAWMSTVEELERSASEPEVEYNRDMYEHMLELAETVQEELFNN